MGTDQGHVRAQYKRSQHLRDRGAQIDRASPPELRLDHTLMLAVPDPGRIPVAQKEPMSAALSAALALILFAMAATADTALDTAPPPEPPSVTRLLAPPGIADKKECGDGMTQKQCYRQLVTGRRHPDP